MGGVTIKRLISKIILTFGFVLIGLFIFEIFGEFSPHVEGVYYLLGVPYQVPFYLAIFAFMIALFLDIKTRKAAIIGLMLLALLFLLFITLYIWTLYSFSNPSYYPKSVGWANR